ncbi:MAG: PaaI family thioesterase [Arenicellales bacterium]|nr:PaaI family thioesterase [Arenicellales bacterium]
MAQGQSVGKDKHFLCLEHMYLHAPINRIYQPEICITDGSADIKIDISEKYFHAAGAVHGSVYFKMLDDAAFFAANSLEQEVFMLTVSFTTYFTRPVSSGVLVARGKVLTQNRTQVIAESVVYNAGKKEIGRGNGIFVRSRIPLTKEMGYREA